MVDIYFFKDSTVGKNRRGLKLIRYGKICEKAVAGVLMKNAHGLVQMQNSPFEDI